MNRESSTRSATRRFPGADLAALRDILPAKRIMGRSHGGWQIGGGVVLMDNVVSHLQEELLAGRMTRRQLIVRAVGLGLSASAIGALLAACGTTGASTQPSAKPRAGGTLRVGLSGRSSSDTLHPHQGLTYLDTARAHSIYQPLLQLNAPAQTHIGL